MAIATSGIGLDDVTLSTGSLTDDHHVIDGDVLGSLNLENVIWLGGVSKNATHASRLTIGPFT